MRRVPLFLLTLLPLTAAVSAQTTPTVVASPEIVVARLMTFDRDNDGRIVKSELPERMQNLLSADASGDQALDRAEIHELARPVPARAAATTVPGLRGGGGGYTFGDQVSLSTRSHVEGALGDLRLPANTQERALTTVRAFMARLEADATAVLMNELEGQMSPGQLGSFRVMFDRQMSGQHLRMPAMMRADGSKVMVFRFGPDLTQIINGFALPVGQTKNALAAFEGFKARIRPADADRAALLAELKDVLSDEERENFDAALQRRPLVKANGLVGAVSGVVGRDVIQSIGGDRAIFTMPVPPERRVVEP